MIVDLSDPTKVITGTLDAPVLAVLAVTGRPLTVGEVAMRAARGSEIGIRRTLARLTAQGIVRATEMGRNRVHELNREHIAAPITDLLAGLRLELWKRLRDAFAGWDPKPLYAAAFGSAARGDGDNESDIDILLVRAPMAGESRHAAKGVTRTIVNSYGLAGAAAMKPVRAEAWNRQVDELHSRVPAWTGNRLQVVELSVLDWVDPAGTKPRLLDDIARDSVALFGHR